LAFRPVSSEGARPQDCRVSFCVGAWSSAFTWRLCGSVVNSAVDRCLLNSLIEQLNNDSLFTRKKFSSQEFSARDIELCAICPTSLAFGFPRSPRFARALASLTHQSHESAPPDWYSMTRVSKKLRSFFRSIISLIHGNGFSSCGNIASMPICCARRFAM
jgi:hypothetical protein